MISAAMPYVTIGCDCACMCAAGIVEFLLSQHPEAQSLREALDIWAIPMFNVEGFPEVFGGSIPARIWHDFMEAALAHTHWASFATPSFTGYDIEPHRVIGLPSPSPSPSPSPKPTCHKPPCKPGH